nr:hypothetical protein [Tanacetum cinerariifolium]
MIPEPGDANREVTMTETFHVQKDDKLFDKELKQIEADDQAIQTIILGLPKDIYAAELKQIEADDQAIQTIILGLPEDIYAAEKKAKLFNEWEMFTSNEGELTESYYHRFLKLMNDLKRNKHFPEKIASNLKFLNNFQPEWSRHNYLQQPMPNPEDITDLTTAMNMTLTLMAKTFKLNYSSPTNNNQRISSNPRNRQIAQLNAGNLTGYNNVQNIGNQVIQNAVQNLSAQNIRNQNGLIGVQGNGNQNQIGNDNLVAACAEENAAGQNGNQI